MKVRIKDKKRVFHSGEYSEMPLVKFLELSAMHKDEPMYKQLNAYLSIGEPERYIIRFNGFGCEVGYPEDQFFEYV